jgi:exosome complex RNA-binding protein Rrp4
MISVTGTQLLNQKDITLGDIGGTFTPAGNQLYIGGIAIIENDMLFADTYSPEIAQNNADYMRQIIGIANSL